MSGDLTGLCLYIFQQQNAPTRLKTKDQNMTVDEFYYALIISNQKIASREAAWPIGKPEAGAPSVVKIISFIIPFTFMYSSVLLIHLCTILCIEVKTIYQQLNYN